MDGQEMELKVIAKITSGFTEKFGIPRQSGLADTKAEIIFEPEYRNADALRGIEEYSHLWLLWGFSEVEQENWRPMVRPPRLGGNKRVGVFATRSPFRPNPIGLSSVELEKVERIEGKGMVLHVKGADLLDGTPIYDIKPYLPYVDCHSDARGGLAEEQKDYALEIMWAYETNEVSDAKKHEIEQILSQDPRPSYQNDPERVYGMEYDGMEIKFQVKEKILYITSIERK